MCHQRVKRVHTRPLSLLEIKVRIFLCNVPNVLLCAYVGLLRVHSVLLCVTLVEEITSKALPAAEGVQG